MKSVFNIFSTDDCHFYYDGEFQGHIVGNVNTAFRFIVQRDGPHLVKFISPRYNSVLIMNLFIGINEEQDVNLDFNDVNAPIILAKEAERRTSEKYESWKSILENKSISNFYRGRVGHGMIKIMIEGKEGCAYNDKIIIPCIYDLIVDTIYGNICKE